MLKAGPGPLIGFFDQAGAHGIAKHVAEHKEKVFILLNRETFEPALPNVTMTLIMLVITADMSHHCIKALRASGIWG